MHLPAPTRRAPIVTTRACCTPGSEATVCSVTILPMCAVPAWISRLLCMGWP